MVTLFSSYRQHWHIATLGLMLQHLADKDVEVSNMTYSIVNFYKNVHSFYQGG